MLPGIDGITILQELRQNRVEASVIVLTARDKVDDRVAGLDYGADDYLVKPFAFDELLARVRALVRRRYTDKSPLIRVSDLVIDTTSRCVERAGRRVELTAREFALLEYLARRAGQIVSRAEVCEHVYDFNSHPASNVVDVYIRYLRKKVERDGLPRLIHTRRGQGYLLGENP